MNQKTANGLLLSSKPETGSIAIGAILSTEKISPRQSGASDLDSLLQALEKGSPEDGALRERLLLHPSEEEKERYPELSKPLAIELFSGLHGWGEGFIGEGYRTVGFDIEDMSASLGIPRPHGCHLIRRDVRAIHGSELKDATVIVSSSPCQEFSYRAMPWKRAKALPPPYLGIELFNAQFRIQREACEAAGRYIPMIVENVRGAQKWVGRACCHYGSFYLWGDVPALMPMASCVSMKGCVGTVNGSGKYREQSPWDRGIKLPGNNSPRRWEDREVKRLRDAGVKLRDEDGYERNHAHAFGWKAPRTSSSSSKRKLAAAMIAKIPFTLANYIAQCFKDTQ